MSGLSALSIKRPAADAADNPPRGPRVADTIDAPVTSPVHELQDQLQRLNAAEPYSPGAQVATKAPGWLRVSLPLGMSIILWAGILWATGALRMIGLMD
ncbi:hypothetical protein GGQ88_002012 [Novosphingobium hassiacum]|uniref:Uncharacterized protein n=1 Tax=Novosphingobium hassiacum TaxID=173676 RepID=A0A7W5ZX50_9SPHN|nr:hypothetical protein [Novosphingobium hassiacum]MBB3860743.1 hypothetical protein [Novosphingobium hassiacum]